MVYDKDYDNVKSIALYIAQNGIEKSTVEQLKGIGYTNVDEYHELCIAMVQESIDSGYKPFTYAHIMDIQDRTDKLFSSNQYSTTFEPNKSLKELEKEYGSRFVEIKDKDEAMKMIESKTSSCWGAGQRYKDTCWIQLATPSPMHSGDLRTVFVCKDSLLTEIVKESTKKIKSKGVSR